MSYMKRSPEYERQMEENIRRDNNSYDEYKDWQYHAFYIAGEMRKAQEHIAKNEVRLTPDMLKKLNRLGKS